MLQEQPQSSDETFDDVTGAPEDQPKEDMNLISQVIAQGKVLAELKATSGWKLIEDFIKMQELYWMEKLVTETDLKRVRKIQCQILAFKSLPEMIEKCLIDSETAMKSLESFLAE